MQAPTRLNLALAAASTLMSLALIEVVLRSTWVPIPRAYHFEPGAVIADPVLVFIQLTDRLAIGRVLFGGVKALFPALGAASVASFDAALSARTAQTREFLLEWKRELDASGAKLAIVHIGDGNFIMPEAWQGYSRRHSHARTFARDELADWCRVQGIAFADAIDPLQEKYVASGRERSSVMLSVDNHYNREGYAVIARVFAELIEREGLLPEAWRARPAASETDGTAAAREAD